MTKIAVLVGSLRADSLNKKFAKAVESFLPEGFEFNYVDVASLPLFDGDQESEDKFPKAASAMKQIIEEADGVFLVTPEYNRSISGVLKNAIDWASRPYGKNSFNGKPLALAGVSMGSLGTAQAQFQLRSIMTFLNAKVMGQPEAYIDGIGMFNDDGTVVEDSIQFVRSYAEAVANFVANNA